MSSTLSDLVYAPACLVPKCGRILVPYDRIWSHMIGFGPIWSDYIVLYYILYITLYYLSYYIVYYVLYHLLSLLSLFPVIPIRTP